MLHASKFMLHTMFDLIIIGGGPAGIAGGVYASRKQLKTLLITKEIGGQSVVSTGIQNWIGTIEISGADLAKSLREHLDAYAGEQLTLVEDAHATNVTGTDGDFTVTTNTGETYTTKTILIASGARRRRLDVPGADEFEHKGVTYCATCDGPMFSGMDVVVVGGGNSGFESAAQLLAYAKSVTLLEHGSSYKAEPVTIEKVLAHENMTGILNATTKEIKGSGMVSGLVYEDTQAGETHELSVQGVFVEIGAIPNTDMVRELIELDEYGRVKIDPWTQQASLNGIWAAGDVTNGLYAQNNIAAGDAVKALEDIYRHLKA